MEDLLQHAKLKQQIHLRLYDESITNTVTKIENAYSGEIMETFDIVSLTFDNHRNSIEKININEIRRSLNLYFRSFQTLVKYSVDYNDVVLKELRPFIREKNIMNLKTIIKSNPNSDDIERQSMFHTDKLLDVFGTHEFNMIIMELFLGTQDFIQWLETMLEQNKILQTHIKKSASS